MNTALSAAVLADSDTGKGSPIGLFVVLLLIVAVYFLYRSMSGHIRRLPEQFPESDKRSAEAGGSGKAAEAGGSGKAETAGGGGGEPVDGPEPTGGGQQTGGGEQTGSAQPRPERPA